MSNTLPTFLVGATEKAASDLATALLRIPEDKRTWSPDDKARSAMDQVAECAIINGYTAELIGTHQWPGNSLDAFFREKAELAAGDWNTLHARLQENTRKVTQAMAAVDDDALGSEIQTPFGTQTLADIMAYPSWNMTYHQGQINYIASLLGVAL